MGIVDRLDKRVRNLALDFGSKAYLFGRQNRRSVIMNMGSSRSGLADSAPLNYWDLMKELRGTHMERALAAETSTWVMRCINYRVNEMHNIEWYITNKDGERLPNQERHPFTMLYRYAYEEYEQDLIERWMMMRLCHGMVFFEKFVGPNNQPGGTMVLNSTYMRPKLDIGTEISGYDYHTGGDIVEYSLDELIIDSIFGYISDVRGKAPLDRALMNVNIDLYNQRTIRSYLLNDNQPGLIISPNNRHGRGISEDSLRKLVKHLKEQRSGPEGAYSSAAMSQPVNVDVVDVQKPDTLLADDARKAICVEFGIDPAVLGVSMTADPLGASTTLQEKRIITLIDIIKPDLRRFERIVNEKIMPWLLEGMTGGRGGRDMTSDRFCWDYMAIDTMIKYTEKALEQAREHHQAGVISTNEFRRMLFLPEIGDGGELPEHGHRAYSMPAEKLRRLYELHSVAGVITRRELRMVLGFLPEPAEDDDTTFSIDPKRYHVLQEKLDMIEGVVPRDLVISQVPAIAEGMHSEVETQPAPQPGATSTATGAAPNNPARSP